MSDTTLKPPEFSQYSDMSNPHPQLRAPGSDEFNSPNERSYEQSFNSVVAQLAEIWGQVLGVSDDHENSSFSSATFKQDLGGDSLQAQQVLARLQQHFGITLTPRTLGASTTIDMLAHQIIQTLQHQPARADVAEPQATSLGQSVQPPVVAEQRQVIRSGTIPASEYRQLQLGLTSEAKIIPCTPAQHTFWLLNRIHPGNAAYHIVAAFSVTGNLNTTLLQQCLQTLVNRHEALRTRFVATNGTPRQVIPATLVLSPLDVHNLTSLAPDSQAREITRLTENTARKPFDLEQGPLLRGLILQLAPQHTIVELVLHHIICDGWSGNPSP